MSEGNNADEVVVGGNGKVWVATSSSVVSWPSNLISALDAAFAEVGYVDENGITFTDGKTIDDIKAWQSAYPIRKLVTERVDALEFVMRQWNEHTVPLAFGGGTISTVGGVTKYYPPTGSAALTVLAMVLEWQDGNDKFRLVIPKGSVTGEVQTKIMRTSAADLPVHFDATPSEILCLVRMALSPGICLLVRSPSLNDVGRTIHIGLGRQ